MPIRTPRGRAAAYRALWQWPLRSPARLGLCVVFVLAAVIGTVSGLAAVRGADAVGSVVAVPGEGAGLTPTPPPSRVITVAPTVLPPVSGLTPSSLPLASAPNTALSVASRWAAAWVDHPPGTTSQQWLARLRPFTTDEYLGVLTGVDPTNVPASKITGEPRPVRVAARSVQVQVPTNTLTLLVLVVATEDGWRVAGYDRV